MTVDVRAGIAGVDEAGRGPLAGPVFAAAVVLDPDRPVQGIRDSKLLSEQARTHLAMLIRERCIAWCVARAEVAEIDRLNILEATMLAMSRAVAGLGVRPRRALVDGNRCPKLACDVEAIVGGDRRVACIGAASILAKVSRDMEMVDLDRRFPGYGFARNKGYPTREHRAALARLGPCPHHRVTFAPVRACIEGGSVGPARGGAVAGEEPLA